MDEVEYQMVSVAIFPVRALELQADLTSFHHCLDIPVDCWPIDSAVGM